MEALLTSAKSGYGCEEAIRAIWHLDQVKSPLISASGRYRHIVSSENVTRTQVAKIFDEGTHLFRTCFCLDPSRWSEACILKLSRLRDVQPKWVKPKRACLTWNSWMQIASSFWEAPRGLKKHRCFHSCFYSHREQIIHKFWASPHLLGFRTILKSFVCWNNKPTKPTYKLCHFAPPP